MKTSHILPEKTSQQGAVAISRQKLVDSHENYFDKSPSGEALIRRHKQAAMVGELLEFKRQKAQKEHDQKRLFFAIGLAVSLLVVITAFEWKFFDEGGQIELNGLSADQFEDLIEIPPTEQLPPPPPQQTQQVVITEIDDEIELEEIDINLDVEVTEDMRISDPVPVVMEELPEEEAEEIFVIVENKPEPVGGMQEFYRYLGENLKYPAAARNMGISGRVYLQFVVEKDGTISNIEVAKGIGGGCDDEAVRVLAAAPPWKPGKQRGQAVKVRMTIPIHFNLKKS